MLHLVLKLKQLGISLAPDGDKLDIYDPEDRLTEALLEELVRHKQELLRFLLALDGKEALRPFRPAEQKEYHPLSSGQRRIYFAQQYDPSGTRYNIPYTMKLPGGVTRQAVEKILNQLLDRHQLLKAAVVRVGDTTGLRINPDFTLSLAALEAEDAGLAGVVERFVAPFDVHQALIRAALVTTAPGEQWLCIDLHHLVADAASVSILHAEFTRLLQGGPLPLCRPYADYVQWESQLEKGEAYVRRRDYWARQLSGLPVPAVFPHDYCRTDVAETRSGTHAFRLSIAPEALGRFCNQHQTTPSACLLAAFYLLHYKLTGTDDLVLGVTAANRSQPELSGMVGLLVNTLPLRIKVEPAASVADLLGSVQYALLEARKHQHFEFERVVDRSRPEDAGLHPLFEVVFNYWEGHTGRETAARSLVHTHSAKFDLVLHVFDDRQALDLLFEYRTKYFGETAMQRYAAYLDHALGEMVADPTRLVSRVQLVPERETGRLAARLRSDAAYPTRETIWSLFEKAATRNPDRVALTYEGQQLNYRALAREVETAAAALQGCGVLPGGVIGLYFQPSMHQVIALLAVLRSGCAYLPLSPDLPAERLRYMLRDSRAGLVICGEAFMQMDGVRTVSMTELLAQPGVPAGRPAPTDPAYLIYTSGTTGRPKGVVIDQGHVVRLFFTQRPLFDFDHRDVWTLFHAYSFDFSVWEIFGALLFGGKLVVVPAHVRKDPAQYLQLLQTERVTVLNQTPSAFYRLSGEAARSGGYDLAVRYVVFGGEALKAAKLRDWHARYPTCRLVNMYGITETTVHVTYKEIAEADIAENRCVIGTPIPTLHCRLLDKDLNQVPAGAIGELYVGGSGVARGYLNNPALTAERFVPDPGGDGVLYKSGDLAKIDWNDELVYIGRNDHQAQLRGFRIELKEIEALLLQCPHVQDCLVAKFETNDHESLRAYVVSARPVNAADLRAYLGARLPEYMVPSLFIPVDSIPLTHNGKVDLGALPAPEPAKGAAGPLPDGYEKEIRAAWARVLGIPMSAIGPADSFFELGGNSLGVIDLAAGLRERLHVDIQLTALFKHHVLAEQCRYLAGLLPVAFKALRHCEQKEYYPLSASQNRVFLLHQLAKRDVFICNVPMVLRVASSLSEARLRYIFQVLFARHEILRTTFHLLDHRVVQQVHPEGRFVLEREEVPYEELSNAIRRFIRPFKLAELPLLRLKLATDSVRQEQYLLLDVHHIVTDWVSINILKEEISRLLAGQTLDPVRYHYRDFTAWEASPAYQERLRESERYWTELFRDQVLPLRLPTDYQPAAAKHDYRGENVTFELSGRELQKIRSFASRSAVTLNAVLLAAYYVLLARLSGQGDVVVGVAVSGRDHPALKDMVGVFINTLPVRAYPEPHKTFRAFLHEVKGQLAAGLHHQSYPFDQLVRKVGNPLARHDFIQAGFSLLTKADAADDPDEENVKLDQLLKAHHKIAHHQLLFYGAAFASKVIFTVEYLPQLFRPDTITLFTECYRNILDAVLDAPDLRIEDIELAGIQQEKALVNAGRPEDSISFDF